MFVILYSVLNKLGTLPNGSSNKTLDSFNDTNELAPYAVDIMKFFVEKGIAAGDGAKLTPKGLSTRAQAAQILYNLLSK